MKPVILFCLLTWSLLQKKKKKKIKNDQQSLTRENLTDKHPNLANSSLKKDEEKTNPPSVKCRDRQICFSGDFGGSCRLYLACNEEPQSEDASLA